MTTFAQALADITGDAVVVDVDDAGDLILELRPGRAATWGAPEGGGGGSQNLAQVLAVGGDPGDNAITGPLIIQPAAGNDASFRVLAPAGMVSNLIVNITSEEGGVGGLNVLKGGGTVLDGAGQAGRAAVEVGASTTGALTLWDRDFNNELLTVGPTGAVEITPTDGVARALTIRPTVDGGGLLVDVPNSYPDGNSIAAFTNFDGAGAQVLGDGSLRVFSDTENLLGVGATNDSLVNVGPTGAVTITQVDANGARTLTVKHADVGNGFEVLRVADGDDNAMLTVDTAGSCAVQLFTAGGLFSVYDVTGSKAVLTVGQSEIGFFTHAPVAQPTGVAVSAAGIHAALVSLGLITA